MYYPKVPSIHECRTIPYDPDLIVGVSWRAAGGGDRHGLR